VLFDLKEIEKLLALKIINEYNLAPRDALYAATD
jgi:hypothetical protein